ncbi:MAG: YdbH domain-containing protein [Proteobacteria bacterium]|nr:YdbH domain-containing protein [Pseudomonadota bacterium]
MNHPEQQPDRGRRVWPIASACLAVLALFGAAAIWEYRLPLGTWAIEGLLERQGMGPVRLVLDRLDWSGLHARNLVLKGGQLTVAELSLAYAAGKLVGLHLDELKATGLRLAPAGPAGSRAEPAPSLSPAAAASAFGGARIDRIRLEDAKLSLPTLSGMNVATLSGAFALSAGALEGASITLDVRGPVAGATHALSLTIPKLTIGPDSGGGLKLQVAGATAMPAGLPWLAEGIDAELVWRSERTMASLSAGTLTDREEPPLVAPLRVSGTASLADAHIDFASRIETQAIGSDTKARMEVKGRYDPVTDSGSAIMTLGPFEFRRGGVQPPAFFPRLGHDFAEVEGRIGLAGSIGWRKGVMLPHLILNLDDVGFDTSAARFSRVNATVAFDELWPPTTPSGQRVSATVEASGLPPSPLHADFKLDRNAGLILSRIELGFAGGRIIASPFAIRPGATEIDTTLRFERIDLADALNLLDVTGLSGSGKLDGELPLTLIAQRLKLGSGKLTASEPGVLSYRGDKLPKEIAGAGREVALAARALEDFHYDALSLAISERDDGEGTILLALRGSNPAVLDGQVFNLNIKLESNFDRLADLALSALASAEELLQRAERSLK